MIRVFTGPDQVPGYTYDQVLKWMIPDFRECAEFGQKRGVVVALQNHEDFVRTAARSSGSLRRSTPVGSGPFSMSAVFGGTTPTRRSRS